LTGVNDLFIKIHLLNDSAMEEKVQDSILQKNCRIIPKYLLCLLGLLLIAATVIAYKPAWNAGYVWDDDAYVIENRLLTAPDGLKRIWFSVDDVRSQYFPLTYTILRIEYSLWGLNPSGYHLVNILLHALNALLLWLLLRRLKLPGAWLAAAIFALHPVHVESVAWITELKNVLSLFFSLLAMLSWIEFVGDRSRPARRYYFLALLLLALALFAKTTACTLPAAMLLVLWLKEKPIGLRQLLQLAPFAALGIGMGLVTMWVERYHGTLGELFSLGLAERVLIAGRAIWFYAGKLLWPVNLTFSYPRWEINAADPLAYVWPAAAVVFCFVVFFMTRRFTGRGVRAAVLFYAATLSPLLGFIMLYTFLYTFVADHYQYAASIGPIALAAAGIARVFDRTKKWKLILVPVICGLLLITLGFMTWRQAGVYVNSETLWRDTIAKNPQSWLAFNNLSAIMLRRGNIDEAITFQEKVVELRPASISAHYNLSISLLRNGRIDEAIVHFEKAVADARDYAFNWKKQGDEFLREGKIARASANYQNTLELCDVIANARRNFCDNLSGNKKSSLCREDRAIFSVIADSHRNLGNILRKQGRVQEADEHFRCAGEIVNSE
jgi:protein O-mannosyl-transferase